MDGLCFVVGAGPFRQARIEKRCGDCLIAADGGYEHLKSMGIRPDFTLGDFDSMESLPESGDFEQFPVQKDETDMVLALRRGLKMGYSRFVLYGGVGGRLDHTLANAQALALLSRQGARAFLVGEGCVLTAITNGELRFPPHKEGTISVFCMGDSASGVTLNGLKYPLTNAVLTMDNPLGVSNSFTGSEARIAVSAGTLLVLWYEEDFSPREVFSCQSE